MANFSVMHHMKKYQNKVTKILELGTNLGEQENKNPSII